MPRKISAKRRATLINDLINADFDLTALHSKYGLSPDSLAEWVQDDTNRRCLSGLCVLADLQTQLLLSRYRLIAAGRLIDLATADPDDSKAGLDNARRACVDLLKLEMKRADINTDTAHPTGDLTNHAGIELLRERMYEGASDPAADTPAIEHTETPNEQTSDD